MPLEKTTRHELGHFGFENNKKEMLTEISRRRYLD